MILYWFTISSYLFSFVVDAWSHCFSSSITVLIPFFLCYTSFQVPHSFLSSLSLLSGDVLRCLSFLTSFIAFLNPSFPPGLQFLFIFTSLIFKANRFPTYRLTTFINISLVCSVLICFNIWFIFLDHWASMHLLILLNPLFYSTFTFH